MKKLLIAIVALVIIAAVAFGVRTLGSRDETDAVNSKQAADLVGTDDASDAADVKAGDRPEPGAYRYTGKGRESVDALGGSEHVFPSEFTSIVRLDPKDDCRWTSNVVYVKQHIEERRFCTKGGKMIDRGFTRKINFFNQLETKEYVCGDDAERLRTTAQEGDVWKWTCKNGLKTSSDYTSTYLGPETLTVGGETVETYHSRVTSKQHGDTNGSDTSEFWLAKTGLIVKFSANLDVKTKSVLGETRFQEHLSYALTSLVPEQA
ncbi:MAG: hypothetical protein JWM98_3300 [Thermoleophilia bacterium]|nr:hypothetical protein [Thermoleophilia bacterium]